MARSTKKGPFIDAHLMMKIEAMNAGQREEGHPHLVAPVHDLPGHGRPHHRRAQRPQVHPGLLTENMVGHKLGEFSATRTFKGHSAKAGDTAKAARKIKPSLSWPAEV